MTVDMAGTDPADEAAALERAAEGLSQSGGSKPAGALLTYLRTHFDAVMKVKADRGLSWPQVAALLSGRGLTKENGSPLDGNVVAVAAARVRYERNPRSRRKRKRTGAVEATAVSPAPAPIPAAPPAEPTTQPATTRRQPANPYAELEQRQDEDRQRRERAAQAKEWNPYAPTKKESDA